jgi:hypothetical protein
MSLRYLGPDTAIPVASAAAAVIGVAVMFWHRTVAAAKGVARFVGKGLLRLTGRR